MKDRELIKVLAEALRPFANICLGPGWPEERVLLSRVDVTRAKAAMTDYRIWQDTPRAFPLPWDPASACEVPAETGDPGHMGMIDQDAEQRKRDMARDEAKLVLSYYFETAWEKMGCQWIPADGRNVDAIVDAILEAAGA